MSTLIIRQPNEAEFEEVKNHLKKFVLDSSEADKGQFKVLLYNDKLAAFGRLKQRNDGIELCSIGVVEEYRGKKLGETIVKDILATAKTDVYLVTVIPAFFSKLGFNETKEYPASLQNKRENFCEHHHPGDCVSVMKYSH